MYLRHHFISCVTLTIILFPPYNYLSLLVFIFGFFIDVDHYLYDLAKTGNLDPISSYKRQMNLNIEIKNQLHIFHTLEFIIPFLILVIISKNTYLFILGIGLILHLILDLLYEVYYVIKKTKLNHTRAYSLIMWMMNN